MEKYKIPRNVKTGFMFMELDIKGWIILLPLAGFTSLILFLIPDIKLRVLAIAFNIGLTHFFLQQDEKTGIRNVTLFYQRFKWMFSNERVIKPTWEEKGDRNESLQITTSFKKRRRSTEARNTN